MEKIKVVEIFSSIEGEGSLIGNPVIFIRLEGCNLRCVWCDTKYSYDTTHYMELTLDEILYNIKKHKNKKVCITGGEPLFNEGFDILLETLLEEEFFVIVETNGTIFRKSIDNLYAIYNNQIHIVCSPKPFSDYKVDSKLKNYISEIKLIVDEFLTEDIVKKFLSFPIILQPEGNKKIFFQKALNLQKLILEKYQKEVRVIPQIHKIFNLK